MTDESTRYFGIDLRVYAFDSAEEAQAFADKLLDFICDQPEAAEVSASTHVVEASHD